MDEQSFLKALQRTVPENVITRDEPAKETLAGLMETYEKRTSQDKKATCPRRRLLRVSTAVAATAAVVIAAVLAAALFFFTEHGVVYARLQILEGEVVVYRDGMETARVREGELDLRDDDKIVTSDETLVSILTHDTDSTRLGGDTELSLDVLDDQRKILTQESGKVYHNDRPGYDYRVAFGDVLVSSSGAGDCVYSTDINGDFVTMRVIEGEISFGWKTSGVWKVGAGEEAVVGIFPKEETVEINSIEPAVLEEEWYQWNFERDELEEPAEETSRSQEPESEDEADIDPESGPEIEPGPAPEEEPAGGGVSLQYMCGETNPADNQVQPRFRIVNNTNSQIRASELTIRYWYTVDGEKPQNFWCDWAALGSGNVQGAFHKLSEARSGADYYLEIGFAPGAGVIAPGGESGEIQCRFAKSDWTNYDESSDHSFDPSMTSYGELGRVTLYRNGALIWGIEPN